MGKAGHKLEQVQGIREGELEMWLLILITSTAEQLTGYQRQNPPYVYYCRTV